MCVFPLSRGRMCTWSALGRLVMGQASSELVTAL